MKTTAMGIILDLAEEQKCFLDGLMVRYCAAVRWAFKRLLEGVPVQETRVRVQSKLEYLKAGGAYQVEIIRKSGRYYVHITIEEPVPGTYTPRNGVIGADTNPNGLGIARTDYLGQFRESVFLPQGEWTYARSNRRGNLTGEAAALLVDLAEKSECMLAVEDLAFKNDKSVSTKFNRISHGFVWSDFLAKVSRRAGRRGVPLVKVKPPFTSVIGILKYQPQFGLSNHESAAYVIARRGMGINMEKVPKPLVNRFVQKKDDFYNLGNWKQWSIIKKAALAAMNKTVEREVQSLVFWQHCRKKVQKAG